MRYSGYLNITTAGTYDFQAFTDDGFRLTIGGEMIMEYPVDRAPESSFATVALVAGLSTFDFVSWEQGGAFVNELSWKIPDSPSYGVVPGAVFYTHIVPAPGALALLALGAGSLALVARRKR